jgi:transposase InsO family protein
MKTSLIIGIFTAAITLLPSISSANSDDKKYPAANFQPKVIYLDKEAVAESFFHSLKTELVHHCDFATRAEAKQETFEYIEDFYNRKRRHSANDYKSPADYEMSLKAA